MKVLAPVIICLWVTVAAPIRAVESVLWLLWQAAVWSYRCIKALRLTIETFSPCSVHNNVENIDYGPNCWELFQDYLKPPHKRSWEPK